MNKNNFLYFNEVFIRIQLNMKQQKKFHEMFVTVECHTKTHDKIMAFSPILRQWR